MIEQHVEIVNLPQINRGLLDLERDLGRLKPLGEQIGEEFYRQEESLFERQQFPALSPAYAEWKRETFGDKPILRATDALFKSFTQQGAEGNIHRVNDLDAEFGSSDFKAIFHHTGTSRMPARDPLAEPEVERYETIAGEYLAEMVSKVGFN